MAKNHENNVILKIKSQSKNINEHIPIEHQTRRYDGILLKL